MPETADLSKLEPLLKKYKGADGILIPILQEAREFTGICPKKFWPPSVRPWTSR